MKIRELHEIATMYTNIGEAISFVLEHKLQNMFISLKDISTGNDGKKVIVRLMYEYGDFEKEVSFNFDVDYSRSMMIDDILIDIAEFVAMIS